MDRLIVSAVLGLAFLTGCGAAAPDTGGSQTPGPQTPVKVGKTFPTAAEAPKYDGAAFSGMQIFDMQAGLYMDEAALMEALDEQKLVFFGEQHETAPVQELELWMLQRLTTRHEDVALAMEHFQRDEQPVIDKYLAGTISSGEFETNAQVWNNYAKYWKPLVDHMKEKGRPVVALNVPKEALDGIYAKYPQKPLDAFNALTASSPFDKQIAPRPLPAYDATFKSYFESSFDYQVHGAKMGMTYAQALDYFADLAHIRDQTMAYFTSQQLQSGGRVLTVLGDWHVQTGLATPDRAATYSGEGAKYELVTTTPQGKLSAVQSKEVSGRKLARYVLVYEAK